MAKAFGVTVDFIDL